MDTPNQAASPAAQAGPTDRDILIAILNLTAALAQRLTGETPELRLDFAGGQHFVKVSPNIEHVRWVKAVAQDQIAGPPGSATTPTDIVCT